MLIPGPSLDRPLVSSLPGLRLVPSLAGVLPAGQESFYLAGQSLAMQRIRAQLQRIAPHFRIALITGEVGTGKETVARLLHARSAGVTGPSGPFVVWQAVKFIERLVDAGQWSELLGEAHGGTLFLDEICGVPYAHQPLLLRLLKQQELRTRRHDLRIVVATDRELRPLMAVGQFREDLYRGMAAVEIGMMPLRKRTEDIAELAAMLLKRAGGRALTAEAEARLEAYEWPENVREMREVVERAVALSQGGVVGAEHCLPLERAAIAVPDSAQKMERLEDVVQRHVLEVLTRCSGNKLRASEVLGISRSTLYRMLDACVGGASL